MIIWSLIHKSRISFKLHWEKFWLIECWNTLTSNCYGSVMNTTTFCRSVITCAPAERTPVIIVAASLARTTTKTIHKQVKWKRWQQSGMSGKQVQKEISWGKKNLDKNIDKRTPFTTLLWRSLLTPVPFKEPFYFLFFTQWTSAQVGPLLLLPFSATDSRQSSLEKLFVTDVDISL